MISPTIFHEPWYLSAASAGRYDEVVIEHEGKVIGRFPYLVQRQSFGRTTCGMPQLTHFLGPAIDDGEGTFVTRPLRRDKLIRSLLEQMPPATGFYHKMHAGITDVIIFQELGYSTSVQFTFEIAPTDASALWLRMRDKTRNAIRKAEKQLELTSDVDPVSFCAFYKNCLLESGLLLSYDTMTLVALCDELLARGRGKILAARREDGTIAAAILYVWDSRASYYLLSTRSSDAGNGAVSFLLWSAIKDTASRGLIFDFDGVATHGSRLFFSGFGGKIVPRYIVFKYSNTHRLFKLIGSKLRPDATTKYF